MPDATPIKSWETLQETFAEKSHSKRRWIYRGQRSDWPLASSLERVVSQRFRLPFSHMPNYRHRFLREFRRHYYRYSTYQPDHVDVVEWLAIMQHHGAPTPLLDWSYSFYVALYFAIEQACIDEVCVVWAIDFDECLALVRSPLPRVYEALWDKESLGASALSPALDSDTPLICPVNTYRLSERQTVQQGVFLVGCKSHMSFKANFAASIGVVPEGWWNLEIQCTEGFLRDAFNDLKRMNINRVSLFPGLDGLAQNLHNLVFLDPIWKGIYPLPDNEEAIGGETN